MGWVKGLEPSTLGTTIRCSNQLSYTHHILFASRKIGTPGGIRFSAEKPRRLKQSTGLFFKSRLSNPLTMPFQLLARQEGFEPPAYCLEGSCSIRLSYWRISIP